MAFYTNVFVRGNNIFYRGVKNDGSRVQKKHHYKPYLFIEGCPESQYKTIDGKSVKKLNFNSIREARSFLDRYKDVSNCTVYGMTNFQYTFIRDVFNSDEIIYDSKQINIGYLDIEVASDEGVPSTILANKEVTAITLKVNDIVYVFGCGSFIAPLSSNGEIMYFRCGNEKELLEQFLRLWDAVNLDVVTGWYVRFFDIPYLVRRIVNILEEKYAKILSPWLSVNEQKIVIRGREELTYELDGISILDYQDLYRKFTFKNHESYKLHDVCQKEVGEGKLDYSEYTSLLQLYKNDFQKFIEYNIKDVILVEKLEKKFGFLELVFELAYDAKVNYNDVMTTIRPWDVIIHNYLLDRNIVVPPKRDVLISEDAPGGWVKEPKKGFTSWVVSFDISGMYPSIIMGYNISTETYIGKSDAKYDLIENDLYLINPPQDDCAITANGCKYRKDKQGFMAALTELKFKQRDEFGKKSKEAKEKGDFATATLFKNKRHAKKIQINSLFGALLNEHFRWYSYNNGEAITTTGQLLIQYVINCLNVFLNMEFNTGKVDYVVASDTDSVYLNLEIYVNTWSRTLGKEVNDYDKAEALDEFCKNRIEPYLEKCFETFASVTRAYQQKMLMKRESISTKGLWRAKKHYILNILNDEGTINNPSILKYTGIAVVRSSTPTVCKKALKEAIELIMRKDEKSLIDFVNKLREEYKTFTFEDIAFPRGVSRLDYYAGVDTVYLKATPIQVKSALLFNSLLEKYKLENIDTIKNGDKIRYVYLKEPNPLKDTCIGSMGPLPKEFDLDRWIDYDKMFETSFIKPLQSITDVIKWKFKKIATLEDFLV